MIRAFFVSILEVLNEVSMTLLSTLLVFLEAFLTILTRFLPEPVIDMFSRASKRILRLWPARGQRELECNAALFRHCHEIARAESFNEICHKYKYEFEEHIVLTTDGYLLGLHRITGSPKANYNVKGVRKPVIYLHHGLLMNSEIWIAVDKPAQSIAFTLADNGYDVWLGNNRGNKYSKKHISLQSSSVKFWNFSMDEFSFYDIPDSINYILDLTKEPSLSYLGFSQGSAQAFAALSIHSHLNKKVNHFIALAPAMTPPGVNSLVQSFTNKSPSMLYFMFGRKIILRSSAFWQSIMNVDLFVRTIDFACQFLFGWQGKNISYSQKVTGYSHLYSFTSVKTVVHWFQIIGTGRFQMYDDDTMQLVFRTKQFYRALPYPTQNIKTPITLIYGMSDSLVDIDALLKELPYTTEAIGVPRYEHLDMIWGKAVPEVIAPKILESLQKARHQNDSQVVLAEFEG